MTTRNRAFVLIPLTRGLVTAISPKDLKKVSQYTWGADCVRGKFYATTRINRKRVYLHRFLLNDPNKEVDHHNLFPLDNRRCNLRLATKFEQQCNQPPRKNSTSKYKGVDWSKEKKKWRARVQAKGKQYHVGYFDSEMRAAKAYDKHARKLHGKFARLNFPKTTQPKPPRVILRQKAGKSVFQRKPRTNTSGYIGVYFHQVRCDWRYCATSKGKHYTKNGFKTAKDAAIARDKFIQRNRLPNRLNF